MLAGRPPVTAGLVLAVLLLAPLAGCLDGGSVDTAAVDAEGVVVVEDPEGAAVSFAAVTVLAGERVLATASADANGTFALAALPAGGDALVVTGPGLGTWRGALADVPARIVLPALADAVLAADDAAPALRFLEPVSLGGAYLAKQEASCEAYNCGASEPVIEVAGDGTIYASGTCCIGESPPIWVSRDGGASFGLLEGDVLRDSFGIEGDFAIDDAGNLYFSDISAASAYFSSWDKDGNHRWTIPAGPFPPLVDRPWIRAGAEDEVFFAYNTGRETRFHKSTDGGITWDLGVAFPGYLGSLGQGPERDHLWLTAQGVLYESTDGGESWSAGEAIPMPSEDGMHWQAYEVPVVDDAGNLWIVYDWRDGDPYSDCSPTVTDLRCPNEAPYHVFAARRDTAGEWHGPFRVSPEAGTHHLPWPAAGREGTLVVAWYGTVADEKGPNDVASDAPWHVYAAVTTDGTAEAPTFQVVRADPEPVHFGPMNRKLLDFLQVDIGPEGAVHLAYAEDRDGRKDEFTHYVRSTTGLALAPAVYPNGPQ